MKEFLPEPETTGQDMHRLIAELFPIHRSIAGPGVRRTLEILQQHIPLKIHEVPSGTAVFDWEVPREWHLQEACIKDADGNKIVDVKQSNLHVINYSAPFRGRVTWAELRPHLVSLPEYPDWIPYRTAYFQEKWGFCITQRQFQALEKHPDARYEVCIDAEFVNGALSYGEFFLPGKTEAEVLISCNVCHPSLANDGLSGVAVAVFLAKYLQQLDRRYGYRFIFIPATIGAITWLHCNQSRLHRIKHGLILQVCGDSGPSTYKKSRPGNAEIDRAAAHVLKHSGRDYRILDFVPLGYDERQFCSPGINLPVGCLMRTPNGQYPQYHTSADNLDLVRPEHLGDSLAKCRAMVDVLENNRRYLNKKPFGEPRLDKWGLYHGYGSRPDWQELQQAILWVLNLSDGTHRLLDIAERAGMRFSLIRQAAQMLEKQRLLKEITET